MNTEQIGKSVGKWLCRMGFRWQTVYLVRHADTDQYLVSFFHDGEENKDYLKFTNKVEKAWMFDKFEDAYRYTYLLANSSNNPITSFVTEAKIKGKDKKREILLSKERYFA